MNRKQRRLKRQFYINKKKAIRKAVKQCYLACVNIKNSDNPKWYKIIQSSLAIHMSRIQCDMIAASIYYPPGGIDNRVVVSPNI